MLRRVFLGCRGRALRSSWRFQCRPAARQRILACARGGLQAHGADQTAQAGWFHRFHRPVAAGKPLPEPQATTDRQACFRTATGVRHRVTLRSKPTTNHGVKDGHTTVKNYVRKHGQRSRRTFVPLAHAPGHAQAAFGEATEVMGGIEQKAAFFAPDFPHSDICVVRSSGFKSK